MKLTINAGDLDAAGKQFFTASDLLPQDMAQALGIIAPQLEDAAKNAIRDVTPGHGGLASTTTASSLVRSTSILTTVRQTKMVTNKKGKSWSLAAILIRGRRALDIIGNPWLYWPGADHPVRQVHQKARAANPYPERAAPAIMSATRIIAEQFAGDFLKRLLGKM